jgi:hypothetical protein
MYAVKKAQGEDIWTVGIVDGSVWLPLKDFHSEDHAFALINYLNGGNGVIMQW